MKRLILFIVLICFVVPATAQRYFAKKPSSGSLTVSDNFDRANSTDLGANWTEVSGQASIVSNTIRGVAAGGALAVYSAQSLSATQWARGTISNIASAGWGGVQVRGSNLASGKSYSGICTPTQTAIYYVSNGTWTSIWSSTSAPNLFVDGDVITIGASGNTITLWKNSSQIAQITDTNNPNAGYAGCTWYDAGVSVDNWTAGEGTPPAL